MTAAPARLPGSVVLEPLHQIAAADDGRWRALGDDPQLLLRWPEGIGAGPCRITVLVDPADAAGPSLYLDDGQGWSEATRASLEQMADGRHWTLLAWLQADARPARFDPVSRAGDVSVGEVLVEPLDESVVLLQLLRRRLAEASVSASAIVDEALGLATARGGQACLAGLGVATGTEEARDLLLPSWPEWIRRHDALSEEQACRLHDAAANLPRRPRVSLVVLIAGCAAGALQGCVDAIAAQVYPDWELCLVAAADHADPTVDALVEAWLRRDGRIRLAAPGTSLGSAIASAGGALVGVLVDAPVLAPHALLACVMAWNACGDARIVYSDVDRLDAGGRRTDPYLKPDWNPELFLGQDFLASFALVSAATVRDAGGARDALNEALVEDLLLRCSARLEPAQVVHVPLVLCSVRGATAGPRTGPASSRALAEHLDAIAPGAVAGEPAGAWGREIRWPLPSPPPKVSLLIPTRDRLELLERCVESISARTTYPDYEIVVVDNQSVEPATLAYLASLNGRPGIRVVAYDKPFNYSAICNFAVGCADGAIVGLVNNDIEVITPDWLERMVEHAARPEVGAVGAMLYYPDDTIQHAGVVVGLGGVAGHAHAHTRRGTAGDHGRAALVQAVSAVTAACLLVRREVYEAAGGFDEALEVAFNDIDFCLRLDALGYRNVWTPFAELYHHESASRGAEDTPTKQLRFRQEVETMLARWAGRLDADPAYNPGLSLASGRAYQRAEPPRGSLAAWLDASGASPLHTNPRP